MLKKIENIDRWSCKSDTFKMAQNQGKITSTNKNGQMHDKEEKYLS